MFHKCSQNCLAIITWLRLFYSDEFFVNSNVRHSFLVQCLLHFLDRERLVIINSNRLQTVSESALWYCLNDVVEAGWRGNPVCLSIWVCSISSELEIYCFGLVLKSRSEIEYSWTVDVTAFEDKSLCVAAGFHDLLQFRLAEIQMIQEHFFGCCTH